MKKYQCDDLFSVLEALVTHNVKHYKSDFEVDQKILRDACNGNNRDYIWFTRDTGTCCVSEYMAYINGTFENAECHHLLPDKTTKAYYVHVEGMKNGKVSGSIYPVNPMKLYEEIEKNQQPAHQVKLTPKEGASFLVSYEDYNNKASFYYREYDVVKKEYVLSEENKDRVSGILHAHKDGRLQAKSGVLEELMPKDSFVDDKDICKKTLSLDEKVSGAKKRSADKSCKEACKEVGR